jgi:hypothetical protein
MRFECSYLFFNNFGIPTHPIGVEGAICTRALSDFGCQIVHAIIQAKLSNHPLIDHFFAAVCMQGAICEITMSSSRWITVFGLLIQNLLKPLFI